MKKFIRILSAFVLFVFSFLAVVSCKQPQTSGTESTPSTEEEHTYTLNKTELALMVGGSETLTVNVSPEKEIAPEFASSNSEVATVSNEGVVVAVAEGSATITVTVDGEELTCAVTVTAKPIEYTYALNFTSVSLEEEQTKKLMVLVDPEKEISPVFASADPNVATVDETGLISAIAAGTTSIKVTVDGQELVCAVTVTAKPIEYTYALNKTEFELYLGEKLQLEVEVEPAKEIVPSWETSNASILEVSATGEVLAVGVGEATIKATVDGQELTCAINVLSAVTVENSKVEDIAGQTIDLTNLSSELNTLYYEHYSGDGVNAKLNAQDLIVSNSIETGASGFSDYKATMSWSNGSNIRAYDVNHNGLCSGAGAVAEVLVDENVKQIRIYTGAWRAEGHAEIWLGETLLASSEKWSASDDGIARYVEFNLTATKASTITVKVIANATGDSGNTSMVAMAIMGENKNAPTTTVDVHKTEMTSHNDCRIDLTQHGNVDWYYVNGGADGSEKAPDRKAGGTAIDISPIKGGGFWDYKAAFTWSDGTVVQSNPSDDDIPFGINNGKCDGAMSVDVTVNATTKHVYLYVGGWSSTYYINVIDSKGNIIYNQHLHDGVNGVTYAYELDFAVNAAAEEKLSFIVYRIGGGNVSLTAVAVSDKDLDYVYALNKENVSLVMGQTEKLVLTANPVRDIEVTFESANEAIVTVASDGTITPVGIGSTQVKAKSNGVEYVCEVVVGYSYSLNKDQLALDLGNSDTLVVTSNPQSEVVVEWSSLNPAVATVENGVVKAVGKGEATIVAKIGDKELVCQVLVSSDVVVTGVTMEDAANTHYYLPNLSNTLDTLYYEHYSNKGVDSPMNREDLIVSNTIEQGSDFWDYKGIFDWDNSDLSTAWYGNTHGKHTNGASPDAVATINVDANVKEIWVFTGAWQGTGKVTVTVNGSQIAESEQFKAEGDGIARLVKIQLNITAPAQIIVKAEVVELTGGNVSNVAIAILGNNPTPATTTVTHNGQTRLTSYNDSYVNLTERGTKDWYYHNYEHNPDYMKDGSGAIIRDSIEVENNGKMWDFRAAFGWTNGTVNETSPIDDDCDNKGTNNAADGAYINMDVAVDATVQHVYLYVGGWESKYYIQAIDSKGNVVINQLIAEPQGGTYLAYEVDFAINATQNETLTFIVYRVTGGNCALAAVAVA